MSNTHVLFSPSLLEINPAMIFYEELDTYTVEHNVSTAKPYIPSLNNVSFDFFYVLHKSHVGSRVSPFPR